MYIQSDGAKGELVFNLWSFQMGFRLNNKLSVLGPMAIFPRTVFSWNINTVQDINEESLSLFFALEPKLDLLVLGIGDEYLTPTDTTRLLRLVRKHKINCEILPTEHVRHSGRQIARFRFTHSVEIRLVSGHRNVQFFEFRKSYGCWGISAADKYSLWRWWCCRNYFSQAIVGFMSCSSGLMSKV